MNRKIFSLLKKITCSLILVSSLALSAQTNPLPEAYSNFSIKTLLSESYSNPIWSPDGQYIAFTKLDMSGIYIINNDGSEIKTLTKELGAGYKFSWSQDNSHIIYRGSRFEGNKRSQFIGLIDVANQTDKISSLYNRLQPPVWQYSEKGKHIVYFVDDMKTISNLIPYSDKNCEAHKIDNVNTFFYYKNGYIHLINEAVKTLDEATAIEGMDPVISPNRKAFAYALNDHIYLRFFDNDTQINLGKGSHPSWSPNGNYIVYQITNDDGHQITGSDLYIMDIESRNSIPLTNTTDIIEVNPCWSPDGQHIVFNDEISGQIYLISFN